MGDIQRATRSSVRVELNSANDSHTFQPQQILGNNVTIHNSAKKVMQQSDNKNAILSESETTNILPNNVNLLDSSIVSSTPHSDAVLNCKKLLFKFKFSSIHIYPYVASIILANSMILKIVPNQHFNVQQGI